MKYLLALIVILVGLSTANIGQAAPDERYLSYLPMVVRSNGSVRLPDPTPTLAPTMTPLPIATPTNTPTLTPTPIQPDRWIVAILRDENYRSSWCDVDVDECRVDESLDPGYLYSPMNGYGVDEAFLFTYTGDYVGAYVGYVVNGDRTEPICHTVPSLDETYCFSGEWTAGVTPYLRVERQGATEYEIDVLIVTERRMEEK